MKRLICVLASAILLLGCQQVGSEKKEEAKSIVTEVKEENKSEDKSNQVQAEKDKTLEAANDSLLYFEYLASRYQEAIEYESNHSGKTVQSPMAALIMAMEELRVKYPEDELIIQKNYQDLVALLNWRSDDFEKHIQSLNQSYQRVPLKNFDVNQPILSQLKESTVGGVKVKNNVLGVVDTNEYHYLILDIYEKVGHSSLYLLALQEGMPKILSANTTLDSIAHTDFVETKEDELVSLYQSYFSQGANNELSEDKVSNVDEIMKNYGESISEVYKEVDLATYGRYYTLAVPDQVLEFGKVEGQPVIFKWYGWSVGTEGMTYEIKAGYVNQSETEVIFFCYQDDELVVLHTVGEPRVEKDEAGAVIDTEVNFEKIDNAILREVSFK